ncbi:MAG: hypothetical protein AAB250_18790, partial [Bdellovibrionota bacterium]
VQFDIEPDKESLENVERIIREWNPNDPNASSYEKKWLNENAVKLVQNAVNIEASFEMMERFGLREKLIKVSFGQSKNSLAWWMNKEPLRTLPVGQGNGKTAADLKLDVLAHEASGLQAFESIIKSHQGAPNVLISRENREGEAAVFGEGFYTRVGRVGARNTGWTIRFQLDPAAREGHDFILKGNYVILRNKAAFKVIQENWNMGIREFVEYVRSQRIDPSDRGVLEKLRRRVLNQVSVVSEGDLRWLRRQALRDMAIVLLAGKLTKIPTALDIYLRLPDSGRSPWMMRFLLRSSKVSRQAYYQILPLRHWAQHTDLAVGPAGLKNNFGVDAVSHSLLNKPHWVSPKLMRGALDEAKKSGGYDRIVTALEEPTWGRHPEFVVELIRIKAVETKSLVALLEKPHWFEHHDLVAELLNPANGRSKDARVENIISSQSWKERPESLDLVLKHGVPNYEIAVAVSRNYIKSEQYSEKDRIRWAIALAESGYHYTDFSSPTINAAVIRHHIKSGNFERVGKALAAHDAEKYPELMTELLAHGTEGRRAALLAMGVERHMVRDSHADWRSKPEFIRQLIESGEFNWQIVNALKVLVDITTSSDLVRQALSLPMTDERKMSVSIGALETFYLDSALAHPELFKLAIEKGYDRAVILKIMSKQTGWSKDPRVLEQVFASAPVKTSDIGILLEASYRRLDLVEHLVKTAEPEVANALMKFVFNPAYEKHEVILTRFLERGLPLESMLKQFEGWYYPVDWTPFGKSVEAMVRRGVLPELLAKVLMSNFDFSTRPALKEFILSKPELREAIVSNMHEVVGGKYGSLGIEIAFEARNRERSGSALHSLFEENLKQGIVYSNRGNSKWWAAIGHFVEAHGLTSRDYKTVMEFVSRPVQKQVDMSAQSSAPQPTRQIRARTVMSCQKMFAP